MEKKMKVNTRAEHELNPHYTEDEYDESLSYKTDKTDKPVSTHDLDMDDPNWTMDINLLDAILDNSYRDEYNAKTLLDDSDLSR